MNGRIRCSSLALLGCLVVLGIVGCGGPTGPTAGVVRFDDGTAVQSGSIEFRRLSDKERFSSRIAGDGSFAPADKKGKVGLPPGKYEVVIVQIVMTEDLAKDAHTHGGTVPRRYADYYTSGLEVEVAEGEADPIEVLIESNDGVSLKRSTRDAFFAVAAKLSLPRLKR